ncbi:hypothetical protein [Luteibaculum oceani]|uniref:Uncharacterized protein n=1 Tax=Luteibaculum oceani TaxID=1294296 RepID=A0A5C6UZU9_9FLAO|nr:hypothetical protein [Luteibaculum oceani]TXC78922.1 hypothetical protein FRX97_06825 [Luteibaculum oceani]
MKFKEVLIERDDIPSEWLDLLGGKFSFWENLKIRGTGSPALSLAKNNSAPVLLPYKFHESYERIPFNLELYPRGVVFRGNWKTKTFWGCILNSEILAISTLINQSKQLELGIKLKSGHLIYFNGRSDQQNAITAFVNKWKKLSQAVSL